MPSECPFAACCAPPRIIEKDQKRRWSVPPASPPPFGRGEFQILLPVVRRHVVLARPDVVPHVLAQWLVQPRHVHGADALLAEEFPNRRRVGRPQKLAARIAPTVLFRARYV